MDETNEVPVSQENEETAAQEVESESQDSVKLEENKEEKLTIEEEKPCPDSNDIEQTTDIGTTDTTAAAEAPAVDVFDAAAEIDKGDETKDNVEEPKDEPLREQAITEANNEKVDLPQEQVETDEQKEPKTTVEECKEESLDNQVNSSESSGQPDPVSTNIEPEVLHEEAVHHVEDQTEKSDANVTSENDTQKETDVLTKQATEIPTTVIVSTTPDVPSEAPNKEPVPEIPTATLAKPPESKRRGSIEKMSNFLRQFRSSGGFKKFTASQFMKVWNHYDSDGNGFIADSELDGFLREFVLSSVGEGEMRPEILSESAMAVFKETFMDAFDENQDGMIDIAELAEILPTDENFLLLFHLKNPVESSVEFMKIWREYDKNCKGYIESKELKSFLKHILDNQRTSVSDEKLEEYTETILNLFDSNRDGKLQLCEMARLMPVKQNFLSKPILKGASCITRSDIDRLFKIYDQNRNGTIEDEELSGLLKDLMDLGKKDYTLKDINDMKKVIMDHWDLDQDGTISKSELRMFLIQQCKLSAESQGLQYDDEDDDYDGDSD